MLRVATGESRSWDATIGMHGKISGHVLDEYGHPLTAPRGATQRYGPRDIFGPGADPELLSAPVDDGFHRLPVAHDQGSNSLGSTDLVP